MKNALTFQEALTHRLSNESSFHGEDGPPGGRRPDHGEPGLADSFGYSLADGPPPPFMKVQTKDGNGVNVRSSATNAQANKMGAISDGGIVRVEGQPVTGQPGSAAWMPITLVYSVGSGAVGLRGFVAGEYLVTSQPPPANAPKAPPPAPVLPKPGPPLNVAPPATPPKPGTPPAPPKPGVSPGPLPPPPLAAKVPSKLPMLAFIGAGIAAIFGLSYFGKKAEEKRS